MTQCRLQGGPVLPRDLPRPRVGAGSASSEDWRAAQPTCSIWWVAHRPSSSSKQPGPLPLTVPTPSPRRPPSVPDSSSRAEHEHKHILLPSTRICARPPPPPCPFQAFLPPKQLSARPPLARCPGPSAHPVLTGLPTSSRHTHRCPSTGPSHPSPRTSARPGLLGCVPRSRLFCSSLHSLGLGSTGPQQPLRWDAVGHCTVCGPLPSLHVGLASGPQSPEGAHSPSPPLQLPRLPVAAGNIQPVASTQTVVRPEPSLGVDTVLVAEGSPTLPQCPSSSPLYQPPRYPSTLPPSLNKALLDLSDPSSLQNPVWLLPPAAYPTL